ncbi:hypothetical protein QQG55_4995 [Brugia pahangi]
MIVFNNLITLNLFITVKTYPVFREGVIQVIILKKRNDIMEFLERTQIHFYFMFTRCHLQSNWVDSN